jgi:AcrR family transcriptional regulator
MDRPEAPPIAAADRPGEGKTKKRPYSMRLRAAAAEATLERILDAATELFMESSYDQVSLDAVARRAGVSLPTVLRKFGSKDALLLACAKGRKDREYEQRSVTPGDVREAARVLAGRYEQLLPMWKRYLGLEERYPAIGQALNEVRRGHLAWLAEAFAPFLPRRSGPARTRRLAALFGATEIYLWWSWREHLGLSQADAERTMIEMLEAIVSRGATDKERGT